MHHSTRQCQILLSLTLITKTSLAATLEAWEVSLPINPSSPAISHSSLDTSHSSLDTNHNNLVNSHSNLAISHKGDNPDTVSLACQDLASSLSQVY